MMFTFSVLDLPRSYDKKKMISVTSGSHFTLAANADPTLSK